MQYIKERNMLKKLVGVLAAAMMMAAPICSFAAVLNDEVTSAKIKEATTGSTSQDTNTGNGIKTGHIVDLAVTTAKIAVGAVTDAKITGPISVGKLPVGTTSTTVAAGNHAHDASYSKKYANIVVVAKSGGDFADPGAAVDSIIDASAANPYLVKIMPGVYDTGINLKPFVSVSGSGTEVTKLTGGITASGNSEISDLSIDTGAYYVFLIGSGAGTTKIRNVSVKATNAQYVIYHYDSNVEVENVKIETFTDTTLTTAAIMSESRWNGNGYNSSKLTLKNSELTVNGENNPYSGWVYAGVWGSGYSTIEIDSSLITINAGQSYGFGAERVSSISNSKIIVNSTNSMSHGLGYVVGTTKIYNTYVDAPVFFDNPSYGGTLKCANVYNANLELLCPAP